MTVLAENEMTCAELVELVTNYLEGVLSVSDRQRFEAHLGSCPGCQTYLEDFRKTIAIVGRISPDTVDPVALEELQQAFRDWNVES